MLNQNYYYNLLLNYTKQHNMHFNISKKDLAFILFITNLIIISCVVINLLLYFSSYKSSINKNSPLSQIIKKLNKNSSVLNQKPEFQIEDLRNRIILINFIPNNCKTCIIYQSEINKIKEDFKSKITLINVYQNSGSKENLTHNYHFDTFALAIHDPKSEIAKILDVTNFPSSVVIKPDGTKLKSKSGSKESNSADLLFQIKQDINQIIDKTPLLQNQEISINNYKFNKRVNILNHPQHIKFTNNLNYKNYKGDALIISNTLDNQIIITKPNGEIIAKFGTETAGFEDGRNEKATFNKPHQTAFFNNKIYVVDSGNNAIREINLITQKTTTIVGSGNGGESIDDLAIVGKNKDIELNYPTEILINDRATNQKENNKTAKIIKKTTKNKINNQKHKTITASDQKNNSDKSTVKGIKQDLEFFIVNNYGKQILHYQQNKRIIKPVLRLEQVEEAKGFSFVNIPISNLQLQKEKIFFLNNKINKLQYFSIKDNIGHNPNNLTVKNIQLKNISGNTELENFLITEEKLLISLKNTSELKLFKIKYIEAENIEADFFTTKILENDNIINNFSLTNEDLIALDSNSNILAFKIQTEGSKDSKIIPKNISILPKNTLNLPDFTNLTFNKANPNIEINSQNISFIINLPKGVILFRDAGFINIANLKETGKNKKFSGKLLHNFNFHNLAENIASNNYSMQLTKNDTVQQIKINFSKLKDKENYLIYGKIYVCSNLNNDSCQVINYQQNIVTSFISKKTNSKIRDATKEIIFTLD